MSRFYIRSRRLSSGPHACPRDTSPSDPPPQPWHTDCNSGHRVISCTCTVGLLFKGCTEAGEGARGEGAERGVASEGSTPTERENLKEGRGVSYPPQLFGTKHSGDSNNPRAGLPERGRCGPHSSTCSEWVACPPGERLQGTWAGPRACAASRGAQFLRKRWKRTDTLIHRTQGKEREKRRPRRQFLLEAEEPPPRMGLSVVTLKSELNYTHSLTASFYPGRIGA